MNFKRSCAAALAAVMLCAFIPASAFLACPALAEDVTPGVDIGSSDGDRDGDGVIEGAVSTEQTPAEELASDIGDAASRGMDDMKEGASEIASDVSDTLGTDTTGKTEDKAKKDTMDAIWVIVAVAVIAGVVAAIAVLVPKRRGREG